MTTPSAIQVTGESRPDFPLQDWDRAPWNRWTFQHIGDFLPTTIVAHDPSCIRKLPVALQPIEALEFTSQGHSSSISNWLETSETDGFIVLSQGQIVFERYFNGMTESTLHLAQSVSKSITATAFGVLVARGLIDTGLPIAHYLPEFKKTGYADALVQQVLDMTSGVRFDENYTDPFSDAGRIDVASGWKLPPEAGEWPASMHDLVLTLEKTIRPHGAAFEYRSIETDVLAMLMERVTGKPLAAVISEEIWRPIGAESDAKFTVDRSGYALADGGFNASLRDFARFGQLWAKRGKVSDQQILSEAWVNETLAGDSSLFGSPYSDVLPGGAYRNQFWLPKARGSVLLCRGVFGQMIYIDTAKDFVAVKVSSWPDFVNPSRVITALAAMERIAAFAAALSKQDS